MGGPRSRQRTHSPLNVGLTMAKPSQVKGLGPRSRVAIAGVELVSARLADVREHDRDLKARPAREAVHDARVSTRRLRSAIHLFGDKQLRQYEQRVKSIQDALGQVRDIQLQIQWLQSQGQGSRGALHPIINERKRKLLAAARELHRRISQWRRGTAPALAKALTSVRSAGRLGGDRMRRRLKKKLARVMPQLKSFDEATDPATIHRLRIALKKLRYDVELLEAAFPAYAGLALSVLAPLQGELGLVHDEDVRSELLAKLGARAREPGRAAIDALLRDVLKLRRQQVNALSEKIGWLVSEKIPERLRRLLD
jgi:CHAD domain-containing protein